MFGKASLKGRVGVFSFARYNPSFFGLAPKPLSDVGRWVPVWHGLVVDAPCCHQQVLLKRACKVASHEILHMFGVKHCVFFHCRMNGSDGYASQCAFVLAAFQPV